MTLCLAKLYKTNDSRKKWTFLFNCQLKIGDLQNFIKSETRGIYNKIKGNSLMKNGFILHRPL